MNEADVKSFCATLQATMLNVLRDQGAISITDSRNLFRLETDIHISLRDLLKPTTGVLLGDLKEREREEAFSHVSVERRVMGPHKGPIEVILRPSFSGILKMPDGSTQTFEPGTCVAFRMPNPVSIKIDNLVSKDYCPIIPPEAYPASFGEDEYGNMVPITPPCTCPTADMMREGWKCNCGVKV